MSDGELDYNYIFILGPFPKANVAVYIYELSFYKLFITNGLVLIQLRKKQRSIEAPHE